MKLEAHTSIGVQGRTAEQPVIGNQSTEIILPAVKLDAVIDSGVTQAESTIASATLEATKDIS